MPTAPLSDLQVSQLIDHLLKSRDPATVGLRRIVKRKSDEGAAFPLKQLYLEQFGTKEAQAGIFRKDEVAVLEMQKEITLLRQRIESEKKKAVEALDAAYSKGLSEGEARGRTSQHTADEKEYLARLAEIEIRIAAMLSDVLESKRSSMVESKQFLLEMSMLIARKVVAAEISGNPDTVLSVIKKAISYISDRERLVVRVNTGDMENVTGKKEFWTSIGERLEGIKIESDDRIEKGGCIIESASGVADARVNVLFDELHDIIEKTWNDVSPT
jgi:flagellar assembly protein FliH